MSEATKGTQRAVATFKGDAGRARVCRDGPHFKVIHKPAGGDAWLEVATTLGGGRFNTVDTAKRKARLVAGVPEPEQCKHTRSTGVLSMSRCTRDTVKDGYCTRHHWQYVPVSERNAKTAERGMAG
jgi:hypothetical protein